MPKLYGPEHILYIVMCFVVAATIFIVAKLFIKTEKQKEIFMRCLGAILFLIILTNRIVLVYEYDTVNWMKILTDSICSTSSYLLGLALLFGKKDNGMLHFLWLISLAGGIITTFYPNFLDQNPSFWYPPTIFGLMHHTFSAIVVIVMLMFKYINLSYKKWRYTLWGLLGYLSYGSFCLCVLKMGNPFYMVEPAVDNTPFTIWVLIPIYVVVYAVIVFLVEVIRNKKRSNKKELI